jgi:hypothetical protein
VTSCASTVCSSITVAKSSCCIDRHVPLFQLSDVIDKVVQLLKPDPGLDPAALLRRRDEPGDLHLKRTDDDRRFDDRAHR